jgi:hypothetical protein
MTHVVDSYDMSLKYFLFPLDPWPLSEKVHFFLPPSHVIIPRIGTSQEGTAGSIGVITIMAIYQL